MHPQHLSMVSYGVFVKSLCALIAIIIGQHMPIQHELPSSIHEHIPEDHSPGIVFETGIAYILLFCIALTISSLYRPVHKTEAYCYVRSLHPLSPW